MADTGELRSTARNAVVRPLARAIERPCSRPGCPSPAQATLTFRYATREAWIQRLAPESAPQDYDLCLAHAARTRPPHGWQLRDRRPVEEQGGAPPGQPAADLGGQETIAVLAAALRRVPDPDPVAKTSPPPPEPSPEPASQTPAPLDRAPATPPSPTDPPPAPQVGPVEPAAAPALDESTRKCEDVVIDDDPPVLAQPVSSDAGAAAGPDPVGSPRPVLAARGRSTPRGGAVPVETPPLHPAASDW